MVRHPVLGYLGLLVAGALSLFALPPERQQVLLDAAWAGDTLVAVGERGTILRSSDQGATWTPAAAPDGAALTCVVFADAKRGWAAGHDGRILVTDDAGASWKLCFEGEHNEPSFLTLLAISREQVVAAGAFGAIDRSTDGGANWAPLPALAADAHLYSLLLMDRDTILITGERGTLFLAKAPYREAESVSPLEAPSLHGALKVDDTTVLAFGLQGHIFRSTDRGRTWAEIPSGTQGLLAAATQLSDGTLVLAGQPRVWLVSKDKGESWKTCVPPLTTGVAKLVPAGANRLLAFGEDGVTVVTLPLEVSK